MPGWLRSALLAACVAASCVEHQAPSLDDADAAGAGGASGGTSSHAGSAGALASGAAAANGGTPTGGAAIGGSNGGTPNAGASNGGAPAGGKPTGGAAGAGALGGGGGGGNAAGGDSSDAGAAGSAGAAGEPTVIAIAKLEPTAGNSVAGEARFEQTGDAVKLSVTLSSCPAGAHALHLHQNPDCSDDANASGGTWSPQGEGIDEITCADDGSGKLEFSPAAGTWSIGGVPSSDLLRHSVVLHAGGKSEAAARIACGLPLVQP